MRQSALADLCRNTLIALAAMASLVVPALAAPPPAAAPAQAFGLAGPAQPRSKPARLAPSQRLGIDVKSAPQVVLLRVDSKALRLADGLAGNRNAKTMRYGIGRDVTVHALDGSWTELPDGSRLWVADIVSPEAIGLRLHFVGVRLPAGGELAVYGANPETGTKAAFARPTEFHHGGEAAARAGSEFWSGSLPGERARVEYLAPAGGDEELPFSIDRLQHLYRDPIADLAKAAGACENDVTCSPDYLDQADAVAGIGTVGQDSLYCSGTVLNTLAGDFTPYYLTAHHCTNTKQDAASAEIYWRYQTAACNGQPPSIFDVQNSVGATLLSTDFASDHTLLMINGKVPADQLYWSGWTSADVPVGTAVADIHHPAGDYKRISFGVNDDPTLTGVGQDGAACADLNFYGGRILERTSWNNGVTEPGSSGSGIFTQDSRQLYGQLFGGPSACGVDPSLLFDCFGRFNRTYQFLAKLLKAGSDDSSEPNGTCGQARNAKGTLRGRIVKVQGDDWYRVSVPRRSTYHVKATFIDANGDIDVAAYAACGGTPISVSNGTTDVETVELANPSSRPVTFYVRVYLADSVRNTYDLTVSR